jgi:hypothetical protein
MKEKINEVLRTKKKYLILAGIYIACLVFTTVFDPWKISVTYKQYYGQSYHYWTEDYEPTENFYKYMVDINAPSQLIKDVPHFRFAARHLLTLGMVDFYTVYGFPNEVDNDIVFYSSEISPEYWRFWATIFFPLIMMLKAFLMKRWFAKEKDRVELKKPRFRFLYYRSESFVAEILADNIAFMVTGVMIRAACGLTEFALGHENQLFDAAETLPAVVMAILFLPCFIPYKVMEQLVRMYCNITFGMFWSAPMSGPVPWLLFLIVMPLASLIAIVVLELFLKLMCRLYETFLLALREISKKLKRLTDNHISDKHIQ